MSNFASPRVLPPFCMARPISSSRATCIALLHDFKSSPRCANVSWRTAGPPCDRPNSTASAKSIPLLEVRASGSSVEGFTRVENGSFPSTQRPPTKLRSVCMAPPAVDLMCRRPSRRTRQRRRHLGQGIRDHRDGRGVLGEVLRIDLVQRIGGAVVDGGVVPYVRVDAY